MVLVWYHYLSGTIQERGLYRCGDLRCRRCAPERVSSFLTKMGQLWTEQDQTLWLAEPVGSWDRQWDGVVRSVRSTGASLDYMVIRRTNYDLGTTQRLLWASVPVPFPQAGVTHWTPFDPAAATVALRDQLCLPGPTGRFPPPRSQGWAASASRPVPMPKAWQRMLCDPSRRAVYDEMCRRYKETYGVAPGDPGTTLPDPDVFRQWLLDIVLFQE